MPEKMNQLELIRMNQRIEELLLWPDRDRRIALRAAYISGLKHAADTGRSLYKEIFLLAAAL